MWTGEKARADDFGMEPYSFKWLSISYKKKETAAKSSEDRSEAKTSETPKDAAAKRGLASKTAGYKKVLKSKAGRPASKSIKSKRSK